MQNRGTVIIDSGAFWPAWGVHWRRAESQETMDCHRWGFHVLVSDTGNFALATAETYNALPLFYADSAHDLQGKLSIYFTGYRRGRVDVRNELNRSR